MYEFFPDGAPIPFAVAPRPYNRTHTITADVVVPDSGAEGVLLTHGSRHGGYCVVVEGGHLHYVHNFLGLNRFTVSSTSSVPAGEHRLRVEVVATGKPDFATGRGSHALVRLMVDDQVVGDGELPWTVPNLYATTGLSCGYAAYDSVDPDRYLPPFKFTGTLHRVVLDLTGEVTLNPEAEMTRLMTQQ